MATPPRTLPADFFQSLEAMPPASLPADFDFGEQEKPRVAAKLTEASPAKPKAAEKKREKSLVFPRETKISALPKPGLTGWAKRAAEVLGIPESLSTAVLGDVRSGETLPGQAVEVI